MKTQLVPLIALTALAACTGGVNVQGSLPSDTQTRAAVTTDGHLQMTAGENQLDVERAAFLLGQMELDGERESSEVESGAQVLELALDGESTPIALVDVPAGTYSEFEMELARGTKVSVEGSEEFGDGSILVRGTFNGTDFTYISTYAPELEFNVGKLQVKDGSVADLTITFDVAAWFVDGSGSLLDPNDAANRDRIEANIQASVAAHAEDEDDGEDAD